VANMGVLPETLCGMDIDAAFAYPTVKMVKIQDARLGMFKFFMVFLIALYVAVFQLWRDGGYLQTEKVSGTARFTLQQPTKNKTSGLSDACSPTDPSCINDFTPLDKLPYCVSSPDDYPMGKQSCQYYENVGLLTMYESSVVITTRITETRQDLACDQESYNISGTTCPKVYVTAPNATETTYYAADVERFTVLFDTAVLATTLDIFGESSEMEGWLYVEKNDALCTQYVNATKSQGKTDYTNAAPCYIEPNKTSANLDYFELETLLQAAGSSLDMDGNRLEGATMVMQVDYSNTLSWKGLSNKIQYTYTPTMLSGSSFKVYDSVYQGYPNYRQNRTLLNKHGIKIDLVQAGDLGAFSFAELLVSLTTSLTLLAMATVITDYIALYVLPDKELYDGAKYEWTEDFSDLRDEMKRKRMERGSRSSRTAAGEGGNGETNDLSYNRLLDSNEHMDLYGQGKAKRGSGGEGKA